MSMSTDMSRATQRPDTGRGYQAPHRAMGRAALEDVCNVLHAPKGGGGSRISRVIDIRPPHPKTHACAKMRFLISAHGMHMFSWSLSGRAALHWS